MKEFVTEREAWMSSCERAEPSILCKEKLLTDRLTLDANTPTWKAYIANHMEDTRLADVVSKGLQELCKLASSIHGRDAVLGKEFFFSFPTWWAFDEIERGLLLAHSVERMKQVGLISHFDKLYKILFQKGQEADILSEVEDSTMADTVSATDGMSVAILWLFGEMAAHAITFNVTVEPLE